MKTGDTRLIGRAATLASVALLALGGAACGDNGDSAGGNRSDAAGSPASADREEIVAVVKRTGELFDKGDTAGACAAMTMSAQEEHAAQGASFAKLTGGKAPAKPTCEAALELIVQAGVIEDFKPRIVSVEIDRDKAFVTGDVSHDKSGDQVAALAQEAGQWKVVRWFTQASKLGSAGPAPASKQ